MKRLAIAAVGLALVVAMGLLPSGTYAAPGITELVSVDSAGSQGNNCSIHPSISGDGRYIAFTSLASNLVPGDTNGVGDVFVHDRQTGATELMSVDSSGNQGNSDSATPAISADGRYVAFYSSASNLVPEDTNRKYDVFVHDRQTGTTELVSVDSSGNQGNGDSSAPTISSDGRYVSFLSGASILVPGDTNNSDDVFVHDRQTGATEQVSVDSSGNQGNGQCEYPAISADGRYVAFASYASNLVPDDTTGTRDVFVHDRQTGATELVSVDSSGNRRGDNGDVSAISGDGRYVAFESYASNLVPDDTNGKYDVFVHDRGLPAPDLVETSVSNPPVSQNRGTSFSVTDTAKNQGAAAAAPSKTRYYLSADKVRGPGDKALTGTRAVPGLAPGQSSTGSKTVTIQASTAPGTYYLLACADDTLLVPESDETNNCIASTGTIQVTAPDLVEASLTNPPSSKNRGTSFSVADTTQNQGGGTAGSSTTRYYLSVDTVRNAGDKLLTGSRAVAGLAPGASSSGFASVTIPGNTTLGKYYLLACADDTLSVKEISETNNCIASTSRILVTAPDLTETALGNPPASVKQGGSFNVTDTAKNAGTWAAGASTTRYYLSLDKTQSASDVLLTGSRAVPALAVGATSTGTVSVTVPATTPLGTYFLLACADNLWVVKESKEGNNCRASGTTIKIVP